MLAGLIGKCRGGAGRKRKGRVHELHRTQACSTWRLNGMFGPALYMSLP